MNANTINVPTNNPTDKISCHVGTPYEILAIITIGEVKGIMEPQNESELSGCWKVLIIINKPIINGMVIGKINCCVSVSLSTAEPTAANILAYNR